MSTQATLTASTAFQQVRESAEALRNDELQVVGTVSPGDVIRQGDLYLLALGGASLAGVEMVAVPNKQLAPGTSQGSRHVITGDATVQESTSATRQRLAEIVAKVAGVPIPGELIGPVVDCVGEAKLTHPEHGHFGLPQGEVFVTVYQRQHAEEIRRQQD